MNESPSWTERAQKFLSPLFFLSQNWISRVGVFLVTTSGVSWLFLLPRLIQGTPKDPYLGLITVFALPGIFFLGLFLIPIGMWLTKRRQAGLRTLPETYQRISLDNPQVRHFLMFLLIATAINVIIAGQLTSRAVTYLEGDQFCGQTCHVPMQPEFVAHMRTNHAAVACTDCHVAEGTRGFISSKIAGTRQLLAVMTGSYSRPIPAPARQKRLPAAETCETCHVDSRLAGDRFEVRTHYAADEQNTPATTVALVRVGGQSWKGPVGIHGAHSALSGHIDYIATDEGRQVIPEVTFTAVNGQVIVYKSNDLKITEQQLAGGEHRQMDCIDCHNRPGHVFELPENAIDKQILDGRISSALPYVKKEAVELLRASYSDRDAGIREVGARLTNFYQTKYPQADPAKVKEAADAVQSIYALNIFPDMKVTWGSYPNNIGHTDSVGCFRCHDGNHFSASGKEIPNDCSVCHDLLAMEEKDPKVLKDMGVGPNMVPLPNPASTH
jgi:hypothetical protein